MEFWKTPSFLPVGMLNGSPEWLGRQAMLEAAHRAGVGLGQDQPGPSRAFTETEMDSPQHCQRKLSAELSERG